MSSDAPPDWLLALIPLGFLIGFPLMWASVMFLLSRIGGWSTLARRYRAEQPFTGQRFPYCSGTLGMVGYNKVLVLGVDERGLHIAVPKIFAIGHPALLVPWSQVKASRKHKLWVPTVGFELGASPAITLRMHRRFADKIEAAAGTHLHVASE
jgi:hypothetical protein